MLKCALLKRPAPIEHKTDQYTTNEGRRVCNKHVNANNAEKQDKNNIFGDKSNASSYQILNERVIYFFYHYLLRLER